MLRRWHRWAAIPAGLFLFFIALTGVLLHVDMIRLGHAPPGHEPKPLGPPSKAVPLPDAAELGAMVGRVLVGARAANPALKIKTIQLDLGGPEITGTAGAGGAPDAPHVKVNARTGAVIAEPIPPADFHYILQDLHAGYFFGWTGRIISILSGISLTILAFTGLQVWWGMRKSRQKGIYWK